MPTFARAIEEYEQQASILTNLYDYITDTPAKIITNNFLDQHDVVSLLPDSEHFLKLY
jgi:hypothetical protein